MRTLGLLCLAVVFALAAGPAAAGDKWAEAGFTAEESAGWQAAQFGPKDAAGWKQAGFAPDKAAQWKKNKFSAQEAAAWPAFESGDAAAWKKHGADAPAAGQFRKAGWDAWDLGKWRDAGFSASDARTLMEAGFSNFQAADGAGWKKSFPVPEIKAWREAGFIASGDKTALRWKKAGFSPAEAGVLLKAGFDSYYPDKALEWKGAGFSAGQTAAWRAAGFGEYDFEHALEWRNSGFAPEEAGAWLKTGFNSGFGKAAAEWKKAGCGPEKTAEWRKAGVTDLEFALAQRWERAGFSAAEVQDWRKAGFNINWDLDKVIAWKKTGLSARETAAHLAAGLTLEQAAALKKASPAGELAELTRALASQPDNSKLSERIIKLYQSATPRPAVPEAAERFMARGVAAMKAAQSVVDHAEAAAEFRKAVLAAPWYAAAYYNLGAALGQAGDHAGAARSLRLYLLADPAAEDAMEARALMHEMEFNAGKTAREGWLAALKETVWHFTSCTPERTWRGTGCTKQEEGSSNWYHKGAGGLVFPGNGTAELPPNYSSLLGENIEKVAGTPAGPAFTDIVWECRYKSGRTARAARAQYYKDASRGGDTFKLSCELNDSDKKSYTLMVTRNNW